MESKKRYVVESEFVYKGCYCVCIISEMGHRCGYVGITKSHPLYGIDYYSGRLPEGLIEVANKVMEGPIGKRGPIATLSNIFREAKDMSVGFIFDVHGGITYSESGETGYPIKSNLYFFGFDCIHYGDSPDYEAAEKVGLDVTYYDRFFEGTVRSLKYVEEECMSLASQLHDIYLLV